MLRAGWAGVRIPAGAREFSSSPKRPDLLWVTEVLCWGKAARDLYLISRLGRNVVMFPLPLYYVASWLERDNVKLHKCRFSLKLLHIAEWWIGKDVTGSDHDLSVVSTRRHIRIKTDIQEGRNKHLRRARQKNRKVTAQPVLIQLRKFKHTMSRDPVLTHKD